MEEKTFPSVESLRLIRATSEATGQFTTTGWKNKEKKKEKRKISLREKFLNWIISWLLPGFHLAKNPPKGYKRPRKAKGGTEHETK